MRARRATRAVLSLRSCAPEFPKPKWASNILGITAGYGLLTMEGQEHSALR